MNTNTQLYIQPLSELVGQQVINSDNISILEMKREEIITLFKSYGLLLFRAFETNVDIFKEFTNSLSTNFMDYAGGVFTRRVINEDATILSVNDFQSEIKLHGEMYYQKKIPLMLWFFCAHPAAQDGETIVCGDNSLMNSVAQQKSYLVTRS